MKNFKIILTSREVALVLSAITNINEYTTEWDNLGGKIREQATKQDKIRRTTLKTIKEI
jgi:hypothetical protein